MAEPQYWLGVATPLVWMAAKSKYDLHQPHPYGFPEGRASVDDMQIGDRIVEYVSGDQTFRAVWEITRGHYQNPDHVLNGKSFPECVDVKPIEIDEGGVSFDSIKDQLNCFTSLSDQRRWGILVQRSARRWDAHDGQIILNALSRSDLADDLREIEQRNNNPTTKRRLIDARCGQGKYRTEVLVQWGHRCAVSGSPLLQVIRASHIKPWKHSTDAERLDPENGLPLIATLDALFDRYLITFDEDGCMKLSPQVASQKALQQLGISNTLQLQKTLTEKQKGYLIWHRMRFLSV